MAVRVKLRLRALKGSRLGAATDTNAIVNTGYEVDEPEIALPLGAAEKLGMWPRLPEGSVVESYRSAGGIVRVHRVEMAVETELMAEDRTSPAVSCSAIIAEGEDEVLISDKLASALGIAIENPGVGTWRFTDEPASRSRGSESPQHW